MKLEIKTDKELMVDAEAYYRKKMGLPLKKWVSVESLINKLETTRRNLKKIKTNRHDFITGQDYTCFSLLNQLSPIKP